MYSDPDFVPFEPPPAPLGLRGLPKLWRSYIETVPRAAYEEGIVRFKGRASDVLIVCEPDLIGEILVERAEAFSRDAATRRAFKPMLDTNSLFVAEGAEWRWQRRAAAPIFRHDTLMSFVPVFATMAERQVERWRSHLPGTLVDAAAAMTRTTFDIIVEAMLGGSAALDAERYGRALTASFETIPWHLIYAMFGLPEWMPFPHHRQAMRGREFIHRDVLRIVEARRTKPSARADLLDLLIAAQDPESGRRMSDDEVMRNLVTFIVAGHETTAVALSWTLWLLAKDQASQQRVVEEVAAVAGDAEIDASHLDGLGFCRQVLHEAMRLFPPAAAISRHPKAAMTVGGMDITTRTRVHIPLFALHRNTRLWQHPTTFDPDRFAAEKVKARSRYAFLPFGAGPRICIGAGFAMTEATVILATLVRALRFAPVRGHRPKPVARVTLRPLGGMPLLIASR